MRTSTRHQLKQDRFAITANEAVSWTVEHRNKLEWGGAILAVVLAIVIGGWWYMKQRGVDANDALTGAIATYNAPLTVAGVPQAPGTKTYANAQDRAKAARTEFQQVANRYGSTKAGQMARYFVGLTDIDVNDTQAAENELKAVSNSGNADVASLAKMALASLYHSTGRDQQAIQLYKEVADKPTSAAPKVTALLAMAETYGDKDPQSARVVYEQIQKEAPTSAAADIAAQKLATMK